MPTPRDKVSNQFHSVNHPQQATLPAEDLALLEAYRTASHANSKRLRKQIDRHIKALFESSIHFLKAGARTTAELTREQAATLRVAVKGARRGLPLHPWEVDGDERREMTYRSALGGVA